jgi:CheY-like chemotaxis protein
MECGGNDVKDAVRVLLAEDNEDHLFLTIRALREAGGIHLEVETVADGREALDYLQRVGRFEGRHRPHLILLDLKLPKIHGLEVLRCLKQDPALREIPVVILTASERPEDITTSYRLGANSYVTKPTTAGGFREGLEQVRRYWTELASLPGSS